MKKSFEHQVMTGAFVVLVLMGLGFVVWQSTDPQGAATGFLQDLKTPRFVFQVEASFNLQDDVKNRMEVYQRPSNQSFEGDFERHQETMELAGDIDLYHDVTEIPGAVTYYVCRPTITETLSDGRTRSLATYATVLKLGSGDPVYTTIQQAIDDAKANANPTTIIKICPGTYAEDLEIKTEHNLILEGLSSGAIITGSGNERTIVKISTPCYYDEWCYGKTAFKNIQLTKNNRLDYPTYGLFLEQQYDCAQDCTHTERATLQFEKGSISNLEVGVYVRGPVDLAMKDVDIHDIRESAITSMTGSIDIQLSDAVYQPEAYALNPQIDLDDVRFYRNYGTFGGVMYARNTMAHLSHVKAYDNACGAMILLFENASAVQVRDSQFYNNSDGSVLSPDSTSSLSLDNVTINDNYNDYQSTAINGGGVITIANSTIENNDAAQGNGGMYFGGSVSVSSANSCWSGNASPSIHNRANGQDYSFGCNDFTCDANGCR